MNKYQLDLLIEHLGYWLSPEELAEVMEWPVPAEEVARDLARKDLVFFARRYLPHYFTLPLAECHWTLFEDIEAAILNKELDQLAESLPRGFGKSTVACIALPLWCIVGDGSLKDPGRPALGDNLVPRKRYIFLIKDSFDQSRIELAALKDEIENNEQFKEDFGDLVGDVTWAANSSVTANGVRIDALGTGMKVRGRRHGPWRPDLIIGDDLENDRHVDSAVQRRKVKSWWFRAVMKAGSPDCDFIVVNTILHRDSLQAYLLKLPDWFSRRWQALIRHANRADLWSEWEDIYRNLEDMERRTNAAAFFEAHRAEMLEGSLVLWPERFPYELLREMMIAERTGETRVSSFAQEMQNIPVAVEDQQFSELHYWHWYTGTDGVKYLVPDEVGSPVSMMSCSLYGACDPSLGLDTGDFTALVDLLVSPQGRMFVAYCKIERWHPDEIIERIVERATYWEEQGFTYRQYGVESVQFQRLLAGLVASRALKSGVRLPLKEVYSKKNKNLRIASLSPDLVNGYLLLYREEGSSKPNSQIALYEQLQDWPSLTHDDGLDALEMARTLAAAVGRGVRVVDSDPQALHLTKGDDPFRMLGEYLLGKDEQSWPSRM